MATIGDINTKISNLTTSDTNQFANSDRLIDINMWLNKIVGMIFDSQDEDTFDDQRNSDYPIKTVPLTTNRDIAIPVSEDVLKIKNLSISYDGINYHRATPIDISQFNDIGNAPAADSTQQTTVDAYFSKNAPCYATKFNSLWIYPLANSSDVASGAKAIVEWMRGPTQFTLSDLTTGTAIPGFDSTFHMMLAYGPAYEFCLSKGLPQKDEIYRELQVYEDRLRKQYSSKQKDRQYQFLADYQPMK